MNTQLNTLLKAVTVHPDRARVLRQGAVQLETGVHTLLISELNLLRWEFPLEPNEKRIVHFDFVVDSPQGMEILGLPL